jgi:hypothetical protein
MKPAAGENGSVAAALASAGNGGSVKEKQRNGEKRAWRKYNGIESKMAKMAKMAAKNRRRNGENEEEKRNGGSGSIINQWRKQHRMAKAWQ